MQIRFTKSLRIALNGINVENYAVGQVVEDPHPDILPFAECYEEVNPQIVAYHKAKERIPVLEAEIRQDKLAAAARLDELERLRDLIKAAEAGHGDEEEVIDGDGDGENDGKPKTVKGKKRK